MVILCKTVTQDAQNAAVGLNTTTVDRLHTHMRCLCMQFTDINNYSTDYFFPYVLAYIVIQNLHAPVSSQSQHYRNQT